MPRPISCVGACPQVQLLTGEYVPILVALILYIYVQSQLTGAPITSAAQFGMIGSTLGRFLFAGRPVLGLAAGAGGATTTYVSLAVRRRVRVTRACGGKNCKIHETGSPARGRCPALKHLSNWEGGATGYEEKMWQCAAESARNYEKLTP